MKEACARECGLGDEFIPNGECSPDCCKKNVSQTGFWRELTECLIRRGRPDEAIEVARAGIKASERTSDYGNSFYQLMQEPLADAFAAKGDHLKAAAIRAEQFLDWQGAYEENRTVELFDKVLDEAEKAGVRDPVRKALIYALETGVNPSPIVTWKFQEAKQEVPWRPIPKKVVYKIDCSCEISPPWPLPWANEGIRLYDSRWKDSPGNCQDDMEFLLKLAVRNGGKAEIARRYDNLPQTPHNYGFPFEGSKVGMLEAVMQAMRGYRDDIVEKLSCMRKWCYVKVEEDGNSRLVKSVRLLGTIS